MTSSTTLRRAAGSLTLSLAMAASLGVATLAGSAPHAPVTAAPAMTPVALSAFSGTLRQGSSGSAVVELQRALGITADGAFGPQTRAAVVAFQSSRGLAADGIAGPRTWAALSGSAPAAPAAAATTSSRPTLRTGSTGTAVVVLQRALGIAADGAFGPQTRSAVVGFQSSHGLAADGIVGSRTWAAIDGGTASRSSSRTPVASSGSRTPVASSSSRGDQLIAVARAQVGKPYVYGANGPDSFDCSGFTQYVYAKLGVSLPHNSAAQYSAVPHVSVGDLRRGDLVFARTNGSITHVGIYDSDGYWYVARHSGTTITRQKIYTSDILVGRP